MSDAVLSDAVLSDVGIRFSSGCEATFKQLNVESASFSQALLYISDLSSVSIESLHIEDVHTTAQELIEVYSGGNLTINGADITFNLGSRLSYRYLRCFDVTNEVGNLAKALTSVVDRTWHGAPLRSAMISATSNDERS